MQAEDASRSSGSSGAGAPGAREWLQGTGYFAESAPKAERFRKCLKFETSTKLHPVHLAFTAVLGQRQDIHIALFTPRLVCISRGDQRVRTTVELGFSVAEAFALWADINARIRAVGHSCATYKIIRAKQGRKGARGRRRAPRLEAAATAHDSNLMSSSLAAVAEDVQSAPRGARRGRGASRGALSASFAAEESTVLMPKAEPQDEQPWWKQSGDDVELGALGGVEGAAWLPGLRPLLSEFQVVRRCLLPAAVADYECALFCFRSCCPLLLRML